MNIEKSIQIYLDWKQSHTISAYERYKVRLKLFTDFISPKSSIEEITTDDVIQFHKHMGTNYSPATISYSARILRNFFWFWQGRGYSNLNPDEIIPIKFISADKDIVTQEDFEDMNLALDQRYFDDLVKKLVIGMLWDTGVRVSELLDITLRSIQKKENVEISYAKVRTRKTMKYNLIAWGKDTEELLNIYLGIRLCMEIESDHLFVNPKTGKPYTSRSIQRWIKDISDLAMIDKNITPHSFRHGKANNILEQGGSMRDVTAMLRHASPVSSFKYVELNPKRFLQTAEKFLKTA